jgi:two-component system, NarL family, nitrate/nitrite response regulator NarL
MIRIAIVDDHQIVIDGLRLLLSHNNRFQVIAEATSANDILDILRKKTVDILMVDIMMPEMDGYELSVRVRTLYPEIKVDIMMPEMDGYELSVRVRTLYPEIKILALSMNNEGSIIDKMIEHARINGYLLKTTGKNELIQAIESVAAGKDYFAPDVLQELNSFHKIKEENQLMNLTARELEIIKCMTLNLTNKQIADQLFISERTVETHRKNIFRKTNTHSVLSLMDFLKKQKIELP